jgi:hypothetical protein
MNFTFTGNNQAAANGETLSAGPAMGNTRADPSVDGGAAIKEPGWDGTKIDGSDGGGTCGTDGSGGTGGTAGTGGTDGTGGTRRTNGTGGAGGTNAARTSGGTGTGDSGREDGLFSFLLGTERVSHYKGAFAKRPGTTHQDDFDGLGGS